MTLIVVAVVLAAAFCHAAWNTILKSHGDRLAGIAQINVLVGVLAAPVLLLVPAPSSESWPYLMASVALHTGYKLFLVRAYSAGDMSQVYPVARGTAPMITAITTWVIIGETLPLNGYLGIACVCIGLATLAIFGMRDRSSSAQPILWALGTACFIAAYTTVDGIGARLSGSPHSYACLLFTMDAVPIALIAVFRRGARAVFRPATGAWISSVFGAGLSLVAFWAVIWAMTEAPIAAVAALRETSVIFGIVLSALILREPLGHSRIPAALCVTAGAILLQL